MMRSRYSNDKRLGIIARCDLGSGLQVQTYNLTRMLSPVKVLIVNSYSFNGRQQYPQMYEGFDTVTTEGFPTNVQALRFLDGLTHVLTAETFYNHYLVDLANRRGIRTYQQYNYEFCEHIQEPRLPTPYKFLAPSKWNIEEMEKRYKRVAYLPPPTFLNEFKVARETNFNRTGRKRFLHVIGKLAEHDRNGTVDIIEALKYSKEDYELVIRSQYPVAEYESMTNDRRITWAIGNVIEQEDMYKDFDAMILPRRYGGLCLPMNEALSSGLPVIMTDISPNNQVLPGKWLVESEMYKQFMARVPIGVYQSEVKQLGEKIDWLAQLSVEEIQQEKLEAFNIAFEEYSADSLLEKYKMELELNV